MSCTAGVSVYSYSRTGRTLLRFQLATLTPRRWPRRRLAHGEISVYTCSARPHAAGRTCGQATSLYVASVDAVRATVDADMKVCRERMEAQRYVRCNTELRSMSGISRRCTDRTRHHADYCTTRVVPTTVSI